jgi:hypothetical protein
MRVVDLVIVICWVAVWARRSAKMLIPFIF